MSKQINVATDFSQFPGGRTRSDGRFSGEEFRQDFIAKPLKEGVPTSVLLDGVAGYGSSFLEEAFGGLVREEGLSFDEIRARLTLVSSDEELIDEIWEYIRAAADK